MVAASGASDELLSWQEIHDLEMREAYPAAIDALEARLRSFPSDAEAVIRLGFNYWLTVVENDRIGANLPTERYAARFIELFEEYRHKLGDNADFCWAYGLGISMSWYEFPGADEETGKSLQKRAGRLDPFYKRMRKGRAPQDQVAARFAGRGVLAAYYAVK